MPKSKAPNVTKASNAPLRRSKRNKLPLSPDASNSMNCLSKDRADFDAHVDFDAHEARWWEKHEDVATELKNTCMEFYGWDESTAQRVLNSYRQFLVVITEAKDSRYLLPCWSVDVMWHRHSLMTSYSSDINTLYGEEVSPNLCVEQARHYILDDTIEALKVRFGTCIDLGLWSSALIRLEYPIERSWTLYSVDTLQPISLCFDDYISSLDDYIYQDQCIRKDFRFVLNDVEIQDNDTIKSLGIAVSHGASSQPVDAIVKVFNSKAISITLKHIYGIRLRNLRFVVWKTTPLLKFFYLMVGADHKNLVFTCNGKRLYTFDTAITLKLKEGDIIETTPVEEYITPGCVCCQKKRRTC